MEIIFNLLLSLMQTSLPAWEGPDREPYPVRQQPWK
jgi:hypothetical protein